MKKTILEIDLNALEHNFNVISSKLKPTTKFMAVVKANGYGSDSLEIAKKLESLNIDYLAVAFASEGVELRKSGIKTPILILLPQVESIKIIDPKTFWVTSEDESNSSSARLMKVKLQI